MTFAEEFCRAHEVAPEDFEEEVLKRALYPAARLVRPLLALDKNYLARDRDFVRGVGRIRRLAEFEIEARDYVHHPGNRGFLRDVLRLRVSVGRLGSLVRKLLRSPGSH